MEIVYKPPGTLRRFTNRIEAPYRVMMGLFALLLIAAFVLDTPQNIGAGLLRIFTSRSVLVTDYAALGGMGAMLVSSVLVAAFSMTTMIVGKVKPSGGILMGLWLILGFGFFGKNLINAIPLVLGVWLFSRFKKLPFRDVSVTAMMVTTVAPIVSEVAYLTPWVQPAGILIGLAIGMVVGFIFAPLAAAMGKVHDGYLLYNAGFVGGLVASFAVSFLRNTGFSIAPGLYWSTELNLPLGILMYIIAAAFILLGFVRGGKDRLAKMRKMNKHSGRLITDYYSIYGEVTYLNMGILCALGTTVTLLIGGHINGATMGGIFCIVGFGALGKNLRNVLPIMIGCTLGAVWNAYWGAHDLAAWGDWSASAIVAPSNMLAILFGTGIAPLAGHFGWKWGILCGFVHLNIVWFVGGLNGGLNLYNNGFAGGFVVIFLFPIITALMREKKENGAS